MVKIGDKIRIIHMEGEPQYTNAVGVVTLIDDEGQIHGTWGGCAIRPDIDEFEILKSQEKVLKIFNSRLLNATFFYGYLKNV